MSFAENLRARRERKKMTRLQLAIALECDPQSIYRWETGAREPNDATREQLAEALGCSVAALYR